jgi:hypothetical protein
MTLLLNAGGFDSARAFYLNFTGLRRMSIGVSEESRIVAVYNGHS